jgi:hypothetical protein
MYNILKIIPVLLSLMAQPVYLICFLIQLFSHRIQLSIKGIYWKTNTKVRQLKEHKYKKMKYRHPSIYEGEEKKSTN